MNNFWQTLPQPFLALAPMEDVTDTVFRQLVIACARPDVCFTEFVNVDGMYSPGLSHVRQRLRFTDMERPLVAQIWGINPQYFYKAARELVDMGFAGIDLNFGCPEKKIVKKGACIALINNRPLATEIIQATKEGAGSKIPLSIKTRTGLDKAITQEWVTFLLKHRIDALTVHGRTAKVLSDVPADWDEIGKAVGVRDKLGVKTLIIGNGDVRDRIHALEFAHQYRVDGVMIGRGIFHNLWAFSNSSVSQSQVRPDVKLRMKLLLLHCQLFKKTWKDKKPFHVLKKYFKIYLSGFAGAKDLRIQLMKTNTVAEVKTTLSRFRF